MEQYTCQLCYLNAGKHPSTDFTVFREPDASTLLDASYPLATDRHFGEKSMLKVHCPM